MAWYSLLPEHLAFWETWIARLFIFLGTLTIGPWAALVVFDLIYYLVRIVGYEFPIVGGRSRGQTRPEAPNLTNRPSGRRRAFSLRGEAADDDNDNDGRNGAGQAGSQSGTAKARHSREYNAD